MQKDYTYYNPRQSALSQARALLDRAAQAAIRDGLLPEVPLPEFIVEIPGDPKNGDVASNLAMAGARAFHRAPRAIAEAITQRAELAGTCFDRLEIAGPGFLNLFLSPDFYSDVVLAACSNPQYGRTDFGAGQRYNVEFVSANPTGPMHLGNARGGALGDCLAAVLDWVGYEVSREFYVNDAGNQIQKFGKSLAVRYLQHCFGPEGFPLPEECYQGEDILLRAQGFAAQQGAQYQAQAEACRGLSGQALFESEAFRVLSDALIAYALPLNVQGLREDLAKYRIQYDTWFRESSLHDSGAVKAIVEKLLASGACYRAEDGAILYKSAQYSKKYGVANKKKADGNGPEEDKDEVLVRANGIPTYFAADIAYHYNKLAVRGFDKAVDVWGADHHGHVARMKGAMDAIGLDGNRLDVVLMQLVRLLQGGKPVRMSKRTGKAITLTTLLDEVPLDSARLFFNMNDADSAVDFDLDLAVRQDSDNPVYYVQYAHARICSMLKKLESEGVPFLGPEGCDPTLLQEESERELVRLLAAFPAELVLAAQSYAPARINRYVITLAGAFHKFYTACRIKDADPALRQARLALCVGVRQVIFNVLTMFKITAPESM